MTDQETREHKLIKVGESVGLRESSEICMELALNCFKEGKSETAENYRRLSSKFKEMGNKRHPGTDW